MNKDLFESILGDVIEQFPQDLTNKSKNTVKNYKTKNYRNRHKQQKFKRSQRQKQAFAKKNTSELRKNLEKTNMADKKVIESPTKDKRKINLTKEEMRKAIIYSEILGKPKSLR
ncbi:MAG: hypothetical protein PUG67_03480 [Peptoniphilaceae bacterium]|nr:hypothetical protein [Peptoniphilaceae bacterium]MDY6018383.1 hypothetical protein [Anaerococcus sp.]